jgi:Oxysterol-binding protein
VLELTNATVTTPPDTNLSLVVHAGKVTYQLRADTSSECREWVDMLERVIGDASDDTTTNSSATPTADSTSTSNTTVASSTSSTSASPRAPAPVRVPSCDLKAAPPPSPSLVDHALGEDAFNSTDAFGSGASSTPSSPASISRSQSRTDSPSNHVRTMQSTPQAPSPTKMLVTAPVATPDPHVPVASRATLQKLMDVYDSKRVESADASTSQASDAAVLCKQYYLESLKLLKMSANLVPYWGHVISPDRMAMIEQPLNELMDLCTNEAGWYVNAVDSSVRLFRRKPDMEASSASTHTSDGLIGVAKLWWKAAMFAARGDNHVLPWDLQQRLRNQSNDTQQCQQQQKQHFFAASSHQQRAFRSSSRRAMDAPQSQYQMKASCLIPVPARLAFRAVMDMRHHDQWDPMFASGFVLEKLKPYPKDEAKATIDMEYGAAPDLMSSSAMTGTAPSCVKHTLAARGTDIVSMHAQPLWHDSQAPTGVGLDWHTKREFVFLRHFEAYDTKSPTAQWESFAIVEKSVPHQAVVDSLSGRPAGAEQRLASFLHGDSDPVHGWIQGGGWVFKPVIRNNVEVACTVTYLCDMRVGGFVGSSLSPQQHCDLIQNKVMWRVSGLREFLTSLVSIGPLHRMAQETEVGVSASAGGPLLPSTLDFTANDVDHDTRRHSVSASRSFAEKQFDRMLLQSSISMDKDMFVNEEKDEQTAHKGTSVRGDGGDNYDDDATSHQGDEKQLQFRSFEQLMVPDDTPSHLRPYGLPGLERHSGGGIFCNNKEEMERQKGVASELAKRIGKSLLSGKSVTTISLPVRIFEPRSFLERMTDIWCFAPIYLPKAASIVNDPVERLKYVIVFLLSGLHRGGKQLKPFNPILGETYQGSMADGGTVHSEQVSHHPPISSFQMFGGKGDWQYWGTHEYNAQIRPNTVLGQQIGPNHIEFNDGTSISFNMPFCYIKGLMWGDRTCWWIGTVQFTDEKNGIGAELHFNPDERSGWSSYLSSQKSPKDTVRGEIYELDRVGDEFVHPEADSSDRRVLSAIQGSWLADVRFDEVEYWRLGQYKPWPIRNVAREHVLPSDCQLREDIAALLTGDLDHAQNIKEKLEQRQRNDRKLRKKWSTK